MYPIIHIILPSYGVMAIVGLFSAVAFLYFRLEKYRIQFSDFIRTLLWCVLFGFIGSRLLFVITRVGWLLNHFSLQNLLATAFSGGFVYYGGLLGVLFGIRWCSRKYEYDLALMQQMVVPAIPLFHFFGRIGCFMAGCCYGFELSSSYTMAGFMRINRFPTQLIEALFELVLFIVLYFFQKKKTNIDWLKFYMLAYAAFRFVIEFTRGDSVRGVFCGVSTSQLISIGIILYYTVKTIIRKHQGKVNKYD